MRKLKLYLKLATMFNKISAALVAVATLSGKASTFFINKSQAEFEKVKANV